VGGKKPVPVDIRVLATSNRDMLSEVRAGRFREDLYYRLNVFPLEIPPLRQRPGDIVALARHALARQAAAQKRTARFAAEAEAKLAAYAWPGNVRELENVVQRALILAEGDVIEADALPLSVGSMQASIMAASVLVAPPSAVPPAPTFAEAVVPQAISATNSAPTNMKDLERQHILDTLAAVNGSRKKAVAILGISERTLRYKLAQYRDEGFFKGDDEE
jgi:two-component system response regulator FlrC